MTRKNAASAPVEYQYAGPENASGTPVVLVHGAYNNAHVWEDNFLAYFAARGYPVYAIHLKPQASASGIQMLFSYRLRDYVDRLAALVDRIGAKPVLVGHSMGGLVVQQYLSARPGAAAGACLLASVPPFGLKNTLLGMLRHPLRLFKYLMLTLAPAVARKYNPPVGLLSDRVDEAQRQRFPSLIGRESLWALLGCLFPKIRKEKVNTTPLLILGAQEDNLALPTDVIKTGTYYDSEAHIFPAMGHFIMLEPDWEQVAAAIEASLLGGEGV